MKISPRVTCLIGVCVAAALLAGCGSAQSRKARYIQHGQQYYNAGNYDKARVEFRNASQIDPKDASVRFLLGEVAEKSGDVRTALGQYQAAVEQDPKLSKARAALARLYVYAGLPAKALEIVTPGLATEPDNAALLTVRGAARQQLGDHDAAFKDAQEAVRRAPDDDYAIALLASLYRQRSQTGQAIEVVQAGLKRLSDNVDLRVILADLYVTQQQPQLAVAQLQKVVSLKPQALSYRYQLAKLYLLQKNADAAESTLRDAVAVNPDSIDAKLQLIDFLAVQRSRARAEAEIDQVLAHAPDNNDLKLALGQLLVQLGAGDKAETLFRNLIAQAGKKPDGLAARDRLAALRLAGNDVKGASALIAQVLNESDRDNDALILRAEIEMRVDANPSAAIIDLRAVLRDQPNAVTIMRTLARAYEQNGESDQAEAVLRSAVQIAPKDPASRLQLAQVLVTEKQLDQAGSMLQQLAKDDPKSIDVLAALFRVQAAQKQVAEAHVTAAAIEKTHPDSALGYYLAGLVDESDNRGADAQRDYEQALKLQPDAGDPLTALMRLDVRLRQPDQAMQRVDAVIASQPGNGLARSLKAELLASQGQMDAAISAYQAAVNAAPTWASAYHGLALAQVATKRYDDAIRTLQQGIGKTQSANALLEDLASLYERLGRPDDAIALYSGVLAEHPGASFAANNLAMLLVSYKSDAASLARARKLADQLASMSLVQVIDTRGWVDFKSGEYHQAETLLQQAVDKSPELPELRYHLGMAQWRSGEQQIAEQNLQAALNAAQPFAGMNDARAALAQLKKAGAAG